MEAARAPRANTPDVAVKYWHRVITRQAWFDPEKEQVVVLLLSTRRDIQGYSLVSMGSLNESVAHPREIFRPAIAAGAYGIILMHNHPSGEPMPSAADWNLTNRIREGAELLQIQFFDHIVVGARPTAFSFEDNFWQMPTARSKRRQRPRIHVLTAPPL